MQTAKEIFLEYQKQAEAHVNLYCQLTDKRPFDNFNAVKTHTRKLLILAHVWNFVARKLAEQKYYQE